MDQYENEDQLDAEIAAMLGQPAPETSDSAVVEENLTTTIDTDPSPEDSPGEDQSQPTVDNDELAKLEKRLKDTQARMTQATQEAAELRRALADKDATISQLQQQLQSQTTPPDDELDGVISDYPEIAGPLVKRNKALEQKIAKLEQALESVNKTTDRMVQSEQQAARNQYESTIRSVHPDVDTIVQEAEYADWFYSQPAMIQQGIQNGDAQDVILALNLYKQSKGIPAEKPDKLAAAKQAATPNVPKNPKPNSQNKTFTREQIAKMSMEEFAKNEGLIDELLASGQLS